MLAPNLICTSPLSTYIEDAMISRTDPWTHIALDLPTRQRYVAFHFVPDLFFRIPQRHKWAESSSKLPSVSFSNRFSHSGSSPWLVMISYGNIRLSHRSSHIGCIGTLLATQYICQNIITQKRCLGYQPTHWRIQRETVGRRKHTCSSQ